MLKPLVCLATLKRNDAQEENSANKSKTTTAQRNTLKTHPCGGMWGAQNSTNEKEKVAEGGQCDHQRAFFLLARKNPKKLEMIKGEEEKKDKNAFDDNVVTKRFSKKKK